MSGTKKKDCTSKHYFLKERTHCHSPNILLFYCFLENQATFSNAILTSIPRGDTFMTNERDIDLLSVLGESQI